MEDYEKKLIDALNDMPTYTISSGNHFGYARQEALEVV